MRSIFGLYNHYRVLAFCVPPWAVGGLGIFLSWSPFAFWAGLFIAGNLVILGDSVYCALRPAGNAEALDAWNVRGTY